MLNKLIKFFHSIRFFYLLFFISDALVIIGLSNFTEAKNTAEERYFAIICIIGALMLILSLSVIFTPPIIRLKNALSAFLLRKDSETDTTTPGKPLQRTYHHFSFIENIVIFATIIGISFIIIITSVVFYLIFKKTFY